MKYEIVSINKLLPLEKVFPTHLKNLEDMINKDGFVLKAVIADKKTGTILDGSHRYVYFLKNGYKKVPVHWADYDDEDIRVGTHLSHRFLIDGDSGISKKECRERALSGNLFPPRTTRHFFTFRKSDISLPLNKLKKGSPIDVSHLIADVDVSNEIEHNRKYIAEINEEIEIILQYLEEVSQTKRYLIEQIERMDSTRQIAFFPGKFHPPHIGQIQTILNIIPKYRKVIIGVSEHAPEVVIATPDDIVSMLKAFFVNFDNVEICKIEKTLVNKVDTGGLPDFDVLLSGNQDVLDWAKSMKINSEYIPRSAGIMCSGTEIRRVMSDG
jgi:nicotinamide mononucleotide adenylyltransferase